MSHRLGLTWIFLLSIVLLLSGSRYAGSAPARTIPSDFTDHFLPVIMGGKQQEIPSITPTSNATFQPSLTPVGTTDAPSPSSTPGATETTSPGTTVTATHEASLTPSPGNTPAATPTPTNTGTATAAATETATVIPTKTATPENQGGKFTNCVSRTGSNATVAIPAEVTINGSYDPAVGDQVAIFTPDGSICAGVATWMGKSVAITAWGDDSQTPEIDGLRGGDVMKFRIWDKSAKERRQVTAMTYSLGDGIFSADSIHTVSSLTVVTP